MSRLSSELEALLADVEARDAGLMDDSQQRHADAEAEADADAPVTDADDQPMSDADEEQKEEAEDDYSDIDITRIQFKPVDHNNRDEACCSALPYPVPLDSALLHSAAHASCCASQQTISSFFRLICGVASQLSAAGPSVEDWRQYDRCSCTQEAICTGYFSCCTEKACGCGCRRKEEGDCCCTGNGCSQASGQSGRDESAEKCGCPDLSDSSLSTLTATAAAPAAIVLAVSGGASSLSGSSASAAPSKRSRGPKSPAIDTRAEATSDSDDDDEEQLTPEKSEQSSAQTAMSPPAMWH